MLPFCQVSMVNSQNQFALIKLLKAIRVWLLLDDAKSGKKKRASSISEYRTDPPISSDWTYIEPVTLVIKRRKVGSLPAKRTQFTLTVSEAVTIHKSQGSTYKKVIIYVNGRSMNRLLLYVACSRATSASGLYLIGSNFEPTKPPNARDVARVNVYGSAPKANDIACFVKTSLLKLDSVNTIHEQLVGDNAGHKMAISAFVFKDALIASVYCSPNFKKDVALTKLEDLLKVDTRFKIISGDFNSHFNDEQNPFSNRFNQYELSSSLGEEVKSTTKYKSFIDNVLTNISAYHSGRYISYTSFHDPLFMQFNF
ncbi:hypothetical protein BD560DRAFT_461654 [Blakeslea trispora]|nr:hypothetical protein BD560DRAFT_461654 [Blakeslea trispora]